MSFFDRRIVVIDTETSGIPALDNDGQLDHRITEIGCVEIINGQITSNNYQVYLDPQREVDFGAEQVHGLSRTDLEQLSEGKTFATQVDDLMDYLEGATLVAHNAKFDTDFIDAELNALNLIPLSERHFKVIDSLKVANRVFPRKKNNLDDLCDRCNVSKEQREFHGALLDAELLAAVFIEMTKGKEHLIDPKQQQISMLKPQDTGFNFQELNNLPVVTPSKDEITAHNAKCDEILKANPDSKIKHLNPK
ncbi:DNA polymerase III subunit epsilon [Vibrio breoganii]